KSMRTSARRRRSAPASAVEIEGKRLACSAALFRSMPPSTSKRSGSSAASRAIAVPIRPVAPQMTIRTGGVGSDTYLRPDPESAHLLDELFAKGLAELD